MSKIRRIIASQVCLFSQYRESGSAVKGADKIVKSEPGINEEEEGSTTRAKRPGDGVHPRLFRPRFVFPPLRFCGKTNAMLPKVLHADEHILVVDKPAGVPVLPDGWDANAPYLRRLLENEFGRVWVVHRLDKGTSGVILFARTPEAHRRLNAQFEQRAVGKVYHAIVEGAPPWENRVTTHPVRANVGRRHRTVVDFKRGKSARTRWKVLKRHPTLSLLEAEPLTGRTHQVRVHASALGHPILGDVLYGASPSDLIARPALHARSIAFTHPAHGERLVFTAPYPSDFAAVLERLEG